MFIDYSNPDNVIINNNGEIITGKIASDGTLDYWLHINNNFNTYPFEIVGLNNNIDIYNFISNSIGYCYHIYHTYSKKDLIEVLDALNKRYDEMFSKTQLDTEENIHPKDLKNGDFIYVEKCDFKAIYIFKSFNDNLIYRHAYCTIDGKEISTDDKYLVYSNITKIRKATKDEIDFISNALLNKGYIWAKYSQRLLGFSPDITKSNIDKIGIEQPILQPTGLKAYQIDCGAIYDTIRESIKVDKIEKDTTISINNFIKHKKHYKLNFNN